MHAQEYQITLKQDSDSTAVVDIHNFGLEQNKAEIRKYQCYNEGTSILESCQSIRVTVSVEYLGLFRPQQPLLIDNPKGGIHEPGAEIILKGSFQNATSYQWYKDGTVLKGCKEDTLVISNATRDDRGKYFLSASNYSGSADSNLIIILVLPKHVP